jgi:methylated-DNA-[protein]-cysteine S-methyltransferase
VEKSRPWAALREQLREYFEGSRDALSLSLDVTAPGEFTGRVWREAGKIPPGRTETYGEIARRAGRRGAARAVGQAMKRNPVPLFIPCHRVVGASGLGGFAGSPSPGMKTRLLALEAGAGEEKRVVRKKERRKR